MIFGCVSANEAASLHSTCTKFFIIIFHFSFIFHIFAPRNVIGSLYKRLKWESGANPGLSRSCKLPFMVQTNASLNFFGKTFASATSQKTCLSLLFFPSRGRRGRCFKWNAMKKPAIGAWVCPIAVVGVLPHQVQKMTDDAVHSQYLLAADECVPQRSSIKY